MRVGTAGAGAARGWAWRRREAVRRRPTDDIRPREKPEGPERGRMAKWVCSRRTVADGIAARVRPRSFRLRERYGGRAEALAEAGRIRAAATPAHVGAR